MFKKMIFTALILSVVLFAGRESNNLLAAEKPAAKPPSAKPMPLPKILEGLRLDHPRLLFTREDQRRIEKLAKTNKLLAEMITQLKYNAELMLDEPVLKHRKSKQKTRLERSRAAIGRIMTLSMAYRLTGDKRFFERARKEMLAAAKLRHWGPGCMLEVAEMTTAMAIGYDWLYDELSSEERAKIRTAIVTKGLHEGNGRHVYMKYIYGKRTLSRRQRLLWERWGLWCYTTGNWNQVCNGGLVIGALAVAEHEPLLAEEIVAQAICSLRKTMGNYKPSGAWQEGPSYWMYGTTYNTLMIAAMDSALGNNFGLSKAEGFDNSGQFRIHTIRPNGLYFKYGDCETKAGICPIMFWMARKFNRPEYACAERQRIRQVFDDNKVGKGGHYVIKPHYICRFFAMEIAWFSDKGKDHQWPLDANLRGPKVAVVTMRSTWDDKHALYAAFKGGDSTAGHCHLDIGTFSLNSDGIGWAIDLGADSYVIPGFGQTHEGARRWDYYRFSTRGHNTLVIGGKNQRRNDSVSRMIDFVSTPDHAHGVLDMSNAYRGQAKKVLRGVAMLDRSRVLVQDEITCLNNDEIRWGMITPADIKLDGSKAILTKDGKTLRAEILSPADAKFKIISTVPPTKIERRNPGTSMLAIFVKPGGKKNVRLAVLFTPVGKGWKKLPLPELCPLDNWKQKK